MISRHKERLIPLDYFNSIGDKPRQTYYMMKEEGLTHEAIEIDANGAPGRHVITDGADAELASYLRPKPASLLQSEQPGRRDDMGVNQSDRRPPNRAGS
jgi:hypothetical protein